VLLGEVVGEVVDARAPYYGELLLFGPADDPLEAHVNGLVAALRGVTVADVH
jgi:hypothetical protein